MESQLEKDKNLQQKTLSAAIQALASGESTDDIIAPVRMICF